MTGLPGIFNQGHQENQDNPVHHPEKSKAPNLKFKTQSKEKQPTARNLLSFSQPLNLPTSQPPSFVGRSGRKPTT